MKKIMTGLSTVCMAVAAFAEDTAISTAEGILTGAQTKLEALLTAAIPIVGALVLAGLGVWGAMRLLPLIKRAFGGSAGR